MNNHSPAHFLCYATIVVVFICGFYFGNNVLVYLKPASSLALVALYFENKKRVNSLYLLIMGIIMINDAFILSNFDENFNIVGILLPTYYLLCSYLLKEYISFQKFRLLEYATFPVIVSILLVAYLTISILNLVLPSLEGSLFFAGLILASLFFYTGICFIIYLQNRYKYGYFLLIAASSCIFVNALLPIQELYYDHPIFTASIHSVDIIAMFFYLKFLVRTESHQNDSKENSYL